MGFIGGRPQLTSLPKPRSLPLQEARRQVERVEQQTEARVAARHAREELIRCAAFLDKAQMPEAHRRCMESIDYVDGLLSAIRGDEEE